MQLSGRPSLFENAPATVGQLGRQQADGQHTPKAKQRTTKPQVDRAKPERPCASCADHYREYFDLSYR